MTSEVVIDVQEKEISIALLEDQKLVEYQNEPRSASFSVGNIYIAKVKKLMPGLNACFVDVGYERDAFLHYLDLGGQFSSFEKYLKQVQSDRKKLYPFSKAYQLPELKKDGSVQNTLSVGQEVLVQIVKEPETVIRVTPKNLEEYLGPRKFRNESQNKKDMMRHIIGFI